MTQPTPEANPLPQDPPVPLDTATHRHLHDHLDRLERLITMGREEIQEHAPAWRRKTHGESRFPVAIAVLSAIGLQLVVPRNLTFKPQWLLPATEILLFLVLLVGNPVRINRESSMLRFAGLALVSAASLATAWSASRLVFQLVGGSSTAVDNPRALLTTGGILWATNVIVFGLWYWEFDRGGPAARAHARHTYPDFLFSQMTAPELVEADWEPGFIDYLYLSFTNATAFSPTDTLPLSRWAKLAMMFQSGVSLVTAALVIARAVNVFK